MPKKVLLLNSVGKDDNGYYIIHSPSRWSQGVKDLSSWFAYYPWELAYSSSLLKKYTDYQVKLIDPCLNRWDKYQTLQAILEESPDWLVIESGTRTIKENLWVARETKKRINAKLVFAGQHPSVFPEQIIAQGIDYVLVGEYEYTLLDLMQGKDPRDIAGLYPNHPRPVLDFSSLPWPEDEDISRISYGIPGEPSSEYLEIQAYASRGCLGNCKFCVCRNIYYRNKTWRPRQVADIINEIRYLKQKYPQLEGIFFDEEAHNTSKKFILSLCDEIIKAGLKGLKFEAMCDIRFLDEQILEAMRNAGYYKIRFGVETADEKCGERIGKKIDIPGTIHLLRFSKKIGLKTYATFMFGLPGAEVNTEKKTINLMEFLIQEELLDNVQISILTPFPGTPLYYWAKNCGYLIKEEAELFDGGNCVILNYPDYTREEIKKIYSTALAIRDHLYFKKNIRRPIWFLKTRYKKYGFRLIFKKLLRRIKVEWDFLKNRNLTRLMFVIILWSLHSSSAQTVKLPSPRLKSNTSLEEAIHNRHSVRNFSARALSLADLSQLLWSVSGRKIDAITSATGNYPSAGKIYGIKIYIYAHNIHGLKKGIYRYEEISHSLEMVSQGDVSEQLASACLNQRFIAQAPSVFIFLGDSQRYFLGYGKRGLRYMYIDLGHCAHNLYLEATALGLGTVAVGAFQDRELIQVLNIKGLQPLYLMPVGFPEQ